MQLCKCFRPAVAGAVAYDDVLQLRAVGSAEGALECAAHGLGAGLEGFEDAATVIVGHHDGEVAGARLVGADEQAVDIVQERQITHERDGARGADLVRAQRLDRQGDADGLGHRPIDASSAAGEIGVNPIKRHARKADVEHRVGAAHHKGVADGQGVAHRGGDVQAGEPELDVRERLAHSVRADLACGLADLQPRIRGLAGDIHACCALVRLAREGVGAA